tara:strand:+ start:584 stop:715 length:132 start_codon:yes stop_codon:yes gene_type:complete
MEISFSIKLELRTSIFDFGTFILNWNFIEKGYQIGIENKNNEN